MVCSSRAFRRDGAMQKGKPIQAPLIQQFYRVLETRSESYSTVTDFARFRG